MDREVVIKLIAEGVKQAVNDLKQAGGSIDNLGNKSKGASAALQEIGRVAFRVASDVSRAFNDVRPIEFGSAGDKARQFSDQIARYAQRFATDANTMRTRFMSVGESVGVSSERVQGFARSLSEMTGTDASGALQDLGTYANETGRELEQVAEIGSTLMAKLGVPVEKVGDSLKRLRDIAQDFSTVGGTVALEKTLNRIAPSMAHMQGGMERNAALAAHITRGMSPEVAQEAAQTFFGAFERAPHALVTRTMRQIKHDPTYDPYIEDPATGRLQLKAEVPMALLPVMRKKARLAVYDFFGGGMTGVQVGERFLRLGMGSVQARQKQAEQMQRALEGQGAIPIDQMTPSQLQQFREKGFAEFGAVAPDQRTEAERIRQQRARVDAERQNVEIEVGDKVQEQRDKRNALYEGKRKEQAAVDTLKAYAPSTVERVADIVEATGVEALTAHKAARSGAPTVEIGQASIDKMARSISKSPLIAKPDKSPSAQSVEDSKAANRSKANY